MTVWAFVDGVKVVGGRKIPLMKSATYRSSNGNTIYTRSWWTDNTQSCNCPGWVNEKKDKRTGEKKPRTCGHVEGKKEDCRVEAAVAMGTFKPGAKIETNTRIIGEED